MFIFNDIRLPRSDSRNCVYIKYENIPKFPNMQKHKLFKFVLNRRFVSRLCYYSNLPYPSTDDTWSDVLSQRDKDRNGVIIFKLLGPSGNKETRYSWNDTNERRGVRTNRKSLGTLIKHIFFTENLFRFPYRWGR